MSGSLKISRNYVADIVDEIALEGLDGITIEALWMRLSVRENFSLKIDDDSKKFIWDIILRLNDVKFYELPDARPSLKYFDYLDGTCHEKAAIELDNLYPHCSVKYVPGILGSCQHYFTRVDVTLKVIELSLKETEDKWGQKLVIVASQDCRTFALVGNCITPNLDFTKSSVQFEILERIGRCRHLGIATCGKGSLQSVVEDSKSIFHYLKFLNSHSLIKKQSVLGSTSTASKVYLTRFFGNCLSDNMIILQTAFEQLKSRPNYMMPCDELYALLDSSRKTRLKKFRTTVFFKKYITVTNAIPYKTVCPNSSQTESERKSKSGERLVRCFQLLNPDIELDDIINKDYEGDDEEEMSGFLPRGTYYVNMPIVAQAYRFIKSSGSVGMTHDELGVKMGVNKAFVRCLLKRLVADKHCTFYIENDGRRRSKRYIVGEHRETKAVASEIAQILSESKEAKEGKEEEGKPNKRKKKTTKAKPTSEPEKSNVPQLQEDNVSYRSLRRIAMIIKTIKAHRFRLFSQITKYVNEEEMKEGLTSRIDRVTLHKILQKLEKDQLIKVIALTGKDVNGHTLKIYTDPAFELDEKLSETLYHSHSFYNTDSLKQLYDGDANLENIFPGVVVENLTEIKKMLSGVVQKSDKSNPEGTKESELAYSPKFMRLNILHDLLFHLVYDYTGVADKTQDEMIEELRKTTAIDENLKKEMPKLYGAQLSTYMFVPPLTISEKLPGWFLISDILIRMPLSVAVKLLRIGETCPDLWEYLHHPVRKHFLLKDLPLSIRQIIFHRKLQISSLYCDLKRLCFVGLLQFGVKFGKEQHQTFVYLNRKASLLDTSKAPPAYYQLPADAKFDRKSYVFEKKSDVRQYWMDMFEICMATDLGVKANMIGKEIPAERELSKESLKKAAEPKTVKKALEDDNGNIPGDNLGAAGLDSVLFSFLRSNWVGPINKSADQVKEKKPEPVTVPLQKFKKDQLKGSNVVLKRNRKKKAVPPKTDNFVGILATPEKPKSKKLRKVKEREVRFKRLKKTSYDEIDIEALKMMNTLRVTWSMAEDNLLLICRVAMMFLCPNFRTFVRIPWAEVRRVLREHLPESRNKTQKAIARRIINMLKNPTTVRSVNLCLEELKAMPETAERFDCADLLNSIKPSTPNLTELQNQLYEKFHELVGFLKDRFVDSTHLNVKKVDEDLIPDSLEKFKELFVVDSSPENSLSIKIIRENVIRAILMSSLSCRADKTSSAVHLFDIYRQYDDDELQNAIRRLHNDKVITISKKAGNGAFKNGNVLPLTFNPYKLSFAFQHLLSVKYAHNMFTESFSQVHNLLQEGYDEEFQVDLNDCNVALFLLAARGLVSFRTVLPHQIIAIDSGDLSDATYSKMLDRYCKMLKFSTSSNSKVVCTSGRIITKPEDEDSLEFDGKRKKRTLPDPKIVHVKKAKLLSSTNSENELVKSNEGKKSPRQEKGEEQPGNESELSCRDKRTRSSRVILYIMREEAKKDEGKFSQELCVVNAPKVFGIIKKDALKLYSEKMGPKVVSSIIKGIIGRALVPINLVDESSVLAMFRGDDHIKAARTTLEFICSRKELGATVGEIKSNCKYERLSEILRDFNDSRVIIRVGIEETMYVSQKYSTPWLLNSFKMTRLEREKVKPNEWTGVVLTGSTSNDAGSEIVPRKKRKRGVINSEDLKSKEYIPPSCSTDANNKIKIIIRPWIRIDGSLNRKVLDRFLGTVLSVIMSNPGISLRAIMDKFSPSITPVWTKDLVEILVEIGCVTLTALRVTEKPTLFSKSIVSVSENFSGLEDDNLVVAEAEIDAVTTLGLFIGKKTYSKDFLVD